MLLSNSRNRARSRQRAGRGTAASSPEGQLLDRDLERMISEYSPLIYHVAYGILHDRWLAEDVVQETLIKAWRNQGAFRGESSLKTWLVRIARNAAIDSLRRQRDRITSRGELPDVIDQNALTDTERVTQGREDVSILMTALGTLDELSRTIVVLRELESMPYQEIAEALEVPISTVKTRLLRARRTLQERLETTDELV